MPVSAKHPSRHGRVASPSVADERARIWRHHALAGVELFRGSYRKYRFAHHFHSIPAIGVVEQGSMSCFWEGSDHLLPAGTVLLLNAGEVHAPGPANSDPWSFRIFFIEDAVLRERSADIGQSLLQFSKPFVEDRPLAESLLRLHRKLETDGTPPRLETSLCDVFTQLALKHTRFSAHKDRSEIENNRLLRVKEYLHANYTHNVSLVEHLAPIAQCSPYHLLRTFRASFGLTPHGYLTQVRIEAAKNLLRSGDSISAVSASTGFTDQSHFTRHFKRILGVTPGQYLPRLQKAQ